MIGPKAGTGQRNNGPSMFGLSIDDLLGDATFTRATAATQVMKAGLFLPGTNDYVRITNSSDLDISGDLDIRVKVSLNDWTPASDQQVFVGKYASSEQSYIFRMEDASTGTLRLIVSGDGTETVSSTCDTATSIADGTVSWIRATFRKSDGRVQFFKSNDGSTWTQIGSDETATITGGSIYNGSSDVTIGANFGGDPLDGIIYHVIVYDSNSKLLEVDFQEQEAGDTSFTSTSGHSVTVVQNGTPPCQILENIVQLVPSGVIRNSHYVLNPVTRLKEKTFLLEQSRENLFTHSEDLDNAIWQKDDMTVSANDAIAPNGKQNSDLVIPSIDNSDHFIYQNKSVTSGEDYILTVYAKSGGYDYIQITGSTGFGTNYQNYDLTDGTLGNDDLVTGQEASVQLLSNGYYRCKLKLPATSTTSGRMVVSVLNADTASRLPAFVGDTTSGVYLWGLQFEESSIESSYILSGASATTRNADNLSYDFTNPPQAMTVYCRFIEGGSVELPVSEAPRLFHIGGNTGVDPRLVCFLESGSTYAFLHDNGTTTSKVTFGSATSLNDLVEYRFVLKSDGSVLMGQTLNNRIEATDTDVTTATLQSSWADTILAINSTAESTAVGLNNFTHLTILKGEKTLEECRSRAGVLGNELLFKYSPQTSTVSNHRGTFTRASTATYHNQLGELQTAAINEVRYDYIETPVDEVDELTILFEEARTNKCQRGYLFGENNNTSAYLTGSYFRLPGIAGNGATIPDSAALSPTGDQSWRVDLSLDDWTPSLAQVLVAKNQTGTNRSIEIHVKTDGKILVWWWESDDTQREVESSVVTGFAAGVRKEIRVDIDVDDGASGHNVQIFTRDIGGEWSQLGDDLNAGSFTTNVQDSATIVTIGGRPDSLNARNLKGNIYGIQMYSDISESDLELDIDFTVENADTPGDDQNNVTTFTEDSSNGATVTIVKSIPGWTLSGDSEAIATLVDDTAELTSAGLQYIITDGMVIKLDNSGGAGAAWMDNDGTTGNTNDHTVSGYFRGTGGGIQVGGIGANSLDDLTTSYLHFSGTATPGASSAKFRAVCAAGEIMYFVLPQMEEASFSTSTIPNSTGSSATRARDLLEFPFTYKPGSYTVYTRRVVLGGSLDDNRWPFSIGGNGGARLETFNGNSGRTTLRFHNGTSFVDSVIASGQDVDPGELVEQRCVLYSTGVTRIFQSRDEASETSGSLNSAVTFVDAWHDAKLYLGNGDTSASTDMANFTHILIVRGEISLAQCRKILQIY